MLCIGYVQDDKEKRDNRGRTPLMLAVTLGFTESVRVLLKFQSNVNEENPDGWSGMLFLNVTCHNILFYILIWSTHTQSKRTD